MSDQQNLDELYRLGFQEKSNGNLEKAIESGAKILAIDPQFQNGIVKKEYDETLTQWTKKRVELLRLEAYRAYLSGNIEEEIRIRNDVLKLDRLNNDARQAIRVFEMQKEIEWAYKQAEQFLIVKDFKSASQQLINIGKQIGFFYDPLKLVSRLEIRNLPKHPVYKKIRDERREKIKEVIFRWMPPITGLFVCIFAIVILLGSDVPIGYDFFPSMLLLYFMGYMIGYCLRYIIVGIVYLSMQD